MCPTDGTGSAAAGSTTGDVLAGAADACTTVGALFETAFWEFPEQPKMVNRTPVDINKKTFFIVVSSQSIRRMLEGSMFLSLRFFLRALNSPKVQVCSRLNWTLILFLNAREAVPIALELCSRLYF
jgi:hypothetical protein